MKTPWSKATAPLLCHRTSIIPCRYELYHVRTMTLVLKPRITFLTITFLLRVQALWRIRYKREENGLFWRCSHLQQPVMSCTVCSALGAQEWRVCVTDVTSSHHGPDVIVSLEGRHHVMGVTSSRQGRDIIASQEGRHRVMGVTSSCYESDVIASQEGRHHVMGVTSSRHAHRIIAKGTYSICTN